MDKAVVTCYAIIELQIKTKQDRKQKLIIFISVQIYKRDVITNKNEKSKMKLKMQQGAGNITCRITNMLPLCYLNDFYIPIKTGI